MAEKKTAGASTGTGGGSDHHGQADRTASDASVEAKRARDPFDIARDEWLERSNKHPGLPLGGFKVLYRICQHASVRQSGYSWFSLARKAADTAMSISAVRRAEDAAVKHGLLLVVSGGDRRRPNQCWPLLDGKPLAGTLPSLPTALRPKMTAVKKRDPSTGTFAAANNGAALRPIMERHCGQFRHRTLLSDPVSQPVSATTPESPSIRHEEDAARDLEVKEEQKKPDPELDDEVLRSFAALKIARPLSSGIARDLKLRIDLLKRRGLTFEQIKPIFKQAGELTKIRNVDWRYVERLADEAVAH